MPRNTTQSNPSIDRSVEETTLETGEEQEITVTVDVDDPSIYTLQEEASDPDALAITDPSSGFEDGPGEVLTEDEAWAAAVTEENAAELSLTYTVSVTSGATEGDYELTGTLVTEDDEVDTGTTTVTVEVSESPIEGITDEQFNAALPEGAETTLSQLRDRIDMWVEEPRNEIDGVDIVLGELRDIIDWWVVNRASAGDASESVSTASLLPEL